MKRKKIFYNKKLLSQLTASIDKQQNDPALLLKESSSTGSTQSKHLDHKFHTGEMVIRNSLDATPR